MTDLIDREKVLEILIDTIDGGEECRGRDTGITMAMDKIRAIPAWEPEPQNDCCRWWKDEAVRCRAILKAEGVGE